MSKHLSDDLFSLIKSLSKSEKRLFKLNSSPAKGKTSVKFVRLFDLYDKAKSLNDRSLQKYFESLTTSQLANQKRHLYTRILESIRNQHRHDILAIKISDYVDIARILYSKGLYRQSLHILDKALQEAIAIEDQILQLEIIEFEKRIEARHITRSRKIANKVERLIDQSSIISTQLSTRVSLSNLALQIHGYYIKHGLVKSLEDVNRINTYFSQSVQAIPISELEPIDASLYYQACMWHNYILTNLNGVYRYAVKWLNIYLDHVALLHKDPEPALRALHYIVNTCFYFRDAERLSNYVRVFGRLKKRMLIQGSTTKMLFFIYHKNALLNLHIVRGEYKKALKHEPDILHQISEYQSFMDTHRIIIFYYKLSWLYFGSGQPEMAIDYLNKILSLKSRFLRADVECYVYFLQLCVHHALDNRRLLTSLLPNTQRKFDKVGLSGQLTQKAFALLRTYLADPDKFQKELQILVKDPVIQNPPPAERHQTVYFNFYFWMLAISKNTTIEKIARSYYLQSKSTHEMESPAHDLHRGPAMQ